MSDPPIKEKRAGNFAITSPNSFARVDHTPIICSAQTWCEPANTRVERQIDGSPPHSVEAEQGLLCSILISPGTAIPKCLEAGIDEKFFYVPAHRTLFAVALDFYDAKKPIDLIIFTQALSDRELLASVGGAAFVTELFGFVPTADNVGYYIDIVRDKHTLRFIIAAGTETVRRAYGVQAEPAEVLSFATANFDALQGRNGAVLPQIEDAAALISQPIHTPVDVIEDVAHLGGKMVLAGSSKTLKSWALVDTGISVATGRKWLDKFTTKRGPVLYINLEIQSGFFAKRIQTICGERQITLEKGFLKIWNLRGFAADLSKLLPKLLRAIRPGEFVLIVIDPIYKLLGARDENKAGDIASLLNEIEQLAVRTGAAVAFAAHYSKGNQSQKESIDRVGGSGVFARDPDTIVNFTKHEIEECFTVEMTLRNHPPREPFVLRWRFPRFIVASELDPAQLKKPGGAPKQFKVEDLVRIVKTRLRKSDILTLATIKLKCSKRTAYDLFAEAVADGLLIETDGEYERPPAT
jgi:hypothetical protein